MKIYKVYMVSYGDYELEYPKAVYTTNYDKAIRIFNDLVRDEYKNSCCRLKEEEFREAIKRFRKWGNKRVGEFICRKYPFIMYKDIYGRLIVTIPYKEQKTCGCEGYNIKSNSLILEEIDVIE